MDRVKLTRRTVTMDHYSQEPLNPHPVFPQWSTWPVYPYQYWGSMRKYLVPQEYFVPEIENEFLRVAVNAEIGGRIWRLHDKIGGHDLANFNTEVHTYNAGFGLNYTSGGIEANYPLAHACTTSRPREITTLRREDGSASIIISEYEQIWRTRWSITYTLHPGRSFLEIRVRIYNRTPHDSRYMYWNNCGFVLTENSEYIFPDSAAAMHGAEERIFSWPMWRHRDLSFYRNVPPEMLGLYMLDTREPFFGYYQHDLGFGLVHYADLADLPGRKHWTWGTDPAQAEMRRVTHHSSGKVFGEIQSGRIAIQEHRDVMPPETEAEWTEIWYPVRGTGAFNGAGPGAALRAEIEKGARGRPQMKVVALANGRFPDARVTVTSDGAAPVETTVSLDPTRSTECLLRLEGEVGPDRHTTVTVRSRDGQVLATCRLREPNTRDSWREVIDLSRPTEPVGAEELFVEAQAKARDWGNHDLRPLYEKVLELDRGFSPARRELGKLATWRGLYDEAIEHFTIARRRDEDSFDLRYFHGVALMLAGRIEEARKAFELAARADTEPRALVRLAELRMREGDWHHALKHLDRLAAAWPRLTRPRGLRAACLRRLARFPEAAAEIAAARLIDGQDPFLQIEEMLVANRDEDKPLPANRMSALLAQVREQEPPLLEAAWDYVAGGLYAEAEIALGIIPDAGPLALLLLAWVIEQQGRGAEALRVLRRACRADVVGHQPWRLELIPVLEWAARRLPDSPRSVFLLGSLLVARRRLEEGVALWEKARQMGEEHYLLAADLGYYHRRVKGDSRAALESFRAAAAAEPGDLYVKREIATSLGATEGRGALIEYLEGELDAVMTSPPLAHALLDAYLRDSRYWDFDQLCSRVDFAVNWQLPGPQSLWVKRHFQEALQLAGEGELERALAMLGKIGPPPANLGITPLDTEDDRRYYHMGCIHEKLGDIEQAREFWERSVAVEHFTGYEKAYWNRQWTRRYYQALSLQKLARASEAEALFDAMELLARVPDLPVSARDEIMGLVERGRFAPDDQKDPAGYVPVEVQTSAEA
ncbi:MAG TPA: DUF5107 domain-containing protein [Armatimonadota bacterium]|nr:DUF5107 domain-containing protein [Armatimonadota bacterium]